MNKRFAAMSVAMAACSALVIGVAGQGTGQELQLVTRAAEALGGRERVMALKTLQIVGYGELAYFDGGGNITGDPAAPQKWQKALEYRRMIDLEHVSVAAFDTRKADSAIASRAHWSSRGCSVVDAFVRANGIENGMTPRHVES